MRGDANIVKQLLQKAKDSALLAVEFYNKPAVSFKSEGYITMMCIAWNSLFHAYFFKHRIKPYYRKSEKGKRPQFEKIPLPPISQSNDSIVNQIEALVDKILAAKKQNPQADTGEWEKEIDRMVYRLYDLTEEEVKIIEEKPQG